MKLSKEISGALEGLKPKVKPIIFLDIDGVLNNHVFSNLAKSHTIDQNCVRNFNNLIKLCDPYIVLSSAWRYMIHGGAMTLKGFEYMLRTHGLGVENRLIGYTVNDETIATRGEQISSWIACNVSTVPYKYVVIDDLDFNIKEHGHPFVKTDGSVGLTINNVEEVLNVLGS